MCTHIVQDFRDLKYFIKNILQSKTVQKRLKNGKVLSNKMDVSQSRIRSEKWSVQEWRCCRTRKMTTENSSGCYSTQLYAFSFARSDVKIESVEQLARRAVRYLHPCRVNCFLFCRNLVRRAALFRLWKHVDQKRWLFQTVCDQTVKFKFCQRALCCSTEATCLAVQFISPIVNHLTTEIFVLLNTWTAVRTTRACGQTAHVFLHSVSMKWFLRVLKQLSQRYHPLPMLSSDLI